MSPQAASREDAQDLSGAPASGWKEGRPGEAITCPDGGLGVGTE